MSSTTETANAVPCDTQGNPLPVMQTRPSFQISPHMVSFLGGVGVTLAIMYLVTQFGSKKRD